MANSDSTYEDLKAENTALRIRLAEHERRERRRLREERTEPENDHVRVPRHHPQAWMLR